MFKYFNKFCLKHNNLFQKQDKVQQNIFFLDLSWRLVRLEGNINCIEFTEQVIILYAQDVMKLVEINISS